MMAKNPQPGEYWLTPFEPHGLVKVLEVHPKTDDLRAAWVDVEYVHSHHGYEAGTTGRYYVFELHALTPRLRAWVTRKLAQDAP